MRYTRLIIAAMLLTWAAICGLESAAFADMTGDHGPIFWANTIPSGSPFSASTQYRGVSFLGRWASYTNADTWYLSWASDDNCYSSWTDGYVDEEYCSSGFYPAYTGQAKVSGSDPMNLTVTNLGRMMAAQTPHGGRYPCGNLVYNGVWYYGTYTVDWTDFPGAQGNWNSFGPFVGFRYSTDWNHYTNYWADGYWTQGPQMEDASHPLFEADRPIRIGSPHFVDFGKNMQYSPDGKGYLVCHGAELASAVHNWIEGDNVYLIRVTPSTANINNASAYQYYAGNDAFSNPIWSNNYSAIKPIISWPGHLGCVTMTYNAPLNRYFMCVTKGKIGQIYDTMILESPTMTGPWTLVQYMQNFGPQAYFVNIPSKFIAADGKSWWLCYSANFELNNSPLAGNPIGGGYTLTLQEMRLNLMSEARTQYNGRIEAELGTKYGAAAYGALSSASAGGVVTAMTTTNSALEFTNVAAATQMTFRYASASAGTMSLYVNGAHAQNVSFVSTGSATSYVDKIETVSVPAGATVKLQRDSADIGVNLDYIYLGATPVLSGKVEAETGIVMNGAAAYPDPLASGGQIVAYLNNTGSALEFRNVAACTQIAIGYATVNTGAFSLYVNGVHSKNITIASNGVWTGSYINRTETVTIPAGATVKIQNDTGDVGINVDYIAFGTPASTNYTITASSGTGGSISPTGSQSVSQGASKTFTITPSTGYAVTNLVVDGVLVGPSSSYTFNYVNANHTISVYYGPNGSGNGLRADYYSGMEFNTFIVRRTNPNINFDWGVGAPDPLAPVDLFSIRWTGQIQPRFSETYRFYIRSDNGRRVWVNNQLIIDWWIDNYDITYRGSIPLVAGQKYDIKVEFFENDGGANAKLEWVSPSQGREVIPQSQFYTTCSITASGGVGGSISPSGNQSYNLGASQIYTITANPGYIISQVTVDGADQGPISSYTFSNLSSSHTISAAFVKLLAVNNRVALTDSKLVGRAVKVWGKIKTDNRPTLFTISDGNNTPVIVKINGIQLTGFGVNKMAVVTGIINDDRSVQARSVTITGP